MNLTRDDLLNTKLDGGRDLRSDRKALKLAMSNDFGRLAHVPPVRCIVKGDLVIDTDSLDHGSDQRSGRRANILGQ